MRRLRPPARMAPAMSLSAMRIEPLRRQEERDGIATADLALALDPGGDTALMRRRLDPAVGGLGMMLGDDIGDEAARRIFEIDDERRAGWKLQSRRRRKQA